MSYQHSLWLWAAVMAWQGSLAWASEAEQNRATARACKSDASRHARQAVGCPACE